MKTKFISLGVACLSFLALTSCMRKANADYSTVRQITKIDTENQVQNNNEYDTSDSGTEKASKYPFYVQLDSTDNLILGQHVYVELDEGQDES